MQNPRVSLLEIHKSGKFWYYKRIDLNKELLLGMQNIQDITWDEWLELARRYQKYVLVAMVFMVFVFYAVVVAPKELPKKSKSSSIQSQSSDRVEWDITAERPEKVFSGVLQGLSGDWYRLGFSTVASSAAQIDAILPSVFSKNVLIGSVAIAESDDFQYHEILFQIPAGRFSDVKLILRNEAVPESWSYTGVKVSEFSLSRLNVRSRFEADRLAPTMAGSIEHKITMLDVSRRSGSKSIFESRFVADADFIENIRLRAKEKSKNSSYVLELREAVKDDSLEDKDISVKRVILKSGEIYSDEDEWGNQSIPLPARLERGKEYLITLTGTGDASRDLVLSPLEGLSGATSDGESIAAIASGRYTSVNGVAMLSGAKVEDFGGEALYTYFFEGGVNDLFDVFATEGKVKFDAKKEIVIGEQKQRTSFTYRFFTVYPFEKFILSARQSGDSEKEVKLEYSFDNVFWREVPATQVSNEPQIFSLVLSGTGKQDTVYVRANYSGEDKKTGSFGLDQLSVRAQLIRK